MDDLNPTLRCTQIGLVFKDDRFGEKTVLKEVTAAFGPGRIALVGGMTGTGKTSLLHLLAGLLRPTCGVVHDGNRPVSRWTMPHLDRWRRSVGMIFQYPHLFGELTAIENVMVPVIPQTDAIRGLRKRAMECLDDLGAGPLADTFGATLSGGERQRVAVARAMICRPRILLADEPTAHQDDAGTARVLAALRSAARRQAVVVVASHDPRVADSEIADDRFTLSNGRLRAEP